MELGAVLHRILIEHNVAVETLLRLVGLFPTGLRPTRCMAGRHGGIACFGAGIHRFMPEFNASFGETVAVPIHHFAGTFGKGLEEALIHVSARSLRGKRNEVELVDFRAPLLLIAGIECGKAFPNTRADREAVDADHLCAAFRSGRHGEHAARAAADDKDFGLNRFDDGFFIDFGRLSEPIAVFVFGGGLFGDHFHRDLAHSLINALLRRTRNCVRRDRRPGNGIELCALRRDQNLLELFCGSLTDRRRFARCVNDDIRDAIGIKSHRDADVTADAGGLG